MESDGQRHITVIELQTLLNTHLKTEYGVRFVPDRLYMSHSWNIWLKLRYTSRTNLHTLADALTELSAVTAGGAVEVGQSPEWGSIKPGAVEAVFGKGEVTRLGMWGAEAGDSGVGVRDGRDVKPVGLFLGATGVGCLWSSLPKLWNTSPAPKVKNKSKFNNVELTSGNTEHFTALHQVQKLTQHNKMTELIWRNKIQWFNFASDTFSVLQLSMTIFGSQAELLRLKHWKELLW